MRLAIVTDIHANRQAWEAVLADIQSAGVDATLCLGDIIGYGPQPAAVLDSVRAHVAASILGNHEAAVCGKFPVAEFNDAARQAIDWTADRIDSDARNYIDALPYTAKVEGVALTHSGLFEPGEFYYIEASEDAEATFACGDFRLTFFGHTHIPATFMYDERTDRITQHPGQDFTLAGNRRYLVNAGSVGEIRTGETTASYCVLDLAANSVCFRRVPFDINAYRRDLAASGLQRSPLFLQVCDGNVVAEAEKLPFALKRRRRANVAALQRTIREMRETRQAKAHRQREQERQENSERREASLELLRHAAEKRKQAEMERRERETRRKERLEQRHRDAEEKSAREAQARLEASHEILRRARAKAHEAAEEKSKRHRS